ncbi:hypothetical protein Tco_0252506 [Tanacetum coccineum]
MALATTKRGPACRLHDPSCISRIMERISKKRTKNEAKTTKPDTEWKSVEKTQMKETSCFREDVGLSGKNSDDTEINTAGAEVSTASHDVSTAAAALVYIRRSASKAKDKGKAIMQEPKPPKKLKKRVQVQMSVDEELARKVQEEEQAKAMAEQEQGKDQF